MKLLQTFLLLALLVLIIIFLGRNVGQNVTVVDLFGKKFQDVNVVWLMLVAFAIGAIIGWVVSFFQVVGAKIECGKLSREAKRLRGELDRLRNLALEEEVPEPIKEEEIVKVEAEGEKETEEKSDKG
ncbi:LapA family protein [candidate division KSB1 bacterium]|nr:LapA family protein [candidate division KSB1 bacterium]